MIPLSRVSEAQGGCLRGTFVPEVVPFWLLSSFFPASVLIPLLNLVSPEPVDFSRSRRVE